MSRDAVGRIGLSGNLKVTKKGPAADLEARVYAEVRALQDTTAPFADALRERAEAAEARVAELEAERDALADEVMRHQVGQSYEVGYEHGSALAQQFKERAERTERTLASVLNASGSA
jgi:hypothetical protein